MTGKRLKNILENVDRSKEYTFEEVAKILKTSATSKFDETVEIAMNLNVDPRKADQNIRGMVQLPHGTGKTIRVAVFAKDDKAEAAKKAGADIVGSDDLAESIQKGKMDFDRCIATPDMMALVGKVGRLLGPKGLMPNPKLGTVTDDVAGAVKAAKMGQVEYRAEKEGVVHAGVGKASFTEANIVENIKAFVSTVYKARPSGVKGTYVNKMAVSTTMGPGLKVSLAELQKL